jgi:hypothetical protein
MKAYIHIGTHKAGSTTIQDYFAQAAPLFGDKLLYYPFGYNLAQKIRDKELTIRMIPHMIPSLEEDLTKTGAKSVFLSGKPFSETTIPPTVKPTRLPDLLKRYFQTSKCI